MVKTTCGHPESAIRCTEEGTCHCTLCEAEPRFWEKVAKRGPDECWLWRGAMTSGYGAFHYQGKPRVVTRLAWLLTHGEIPEGKWVSHTCGQRACVNPDHLVLVDPPGHNALSAQRGTDNFNAILDADKAREIMRRYRGGERQVALAREFGVSQSAISMLINGKTWGWATDA